jgi:radical SAM superfamily enzyme YgiQ (UPF0313 family)
MINFLWINAINSFSEVETRYPNLGIGYLVASLKTSFGDDCFHFKIVNSNIGEALDEFKPHVVGISCVSQNYGLARDYAQIAHEKGIPVIVGGVHISFLPQTLSKSMAVGCIGEGEDTIVDLMHVFLAHHGFPAAALDKTLGIVYWGENGVLRQTAVRAGRNNLDTLPLPDRSLTPISTHTYMFTSRGCPYRCKFCASSRFWNNVRFFSAEHVANEIELLMNQYGVRFISFFDDLFVANKKRFFEIVDLIEKRGILGKVKFSCSLRANTVKEDVVAALKRMGVSSVGMGLESGNQRVLTWLKGGNISVEQNSNAVALLKKHGIMPNASFVIGSPDETAEEILDTLRFIKKVDLALFDVYVITPFPGTPVWEIAKEKKLVSEEESMDWSRLNVNFETNHNKAIILSDILSPRELVKLYGKFRRYRLFHNAIKIWKHPMLSDLSRYILTYMLERIRLFISRLHSGN